MVSIKGVWKSAARKQPAKPKRPLKASPIFISRSKKNLVLESEISPVAKPRMTDVKKSPRGKERARFCELVCRSRCSNKREETEEKGNNPAHQIDAPLTLAWFPAFPPAPTSIVKNRIITMCSSSNASFWANIKEDMDCKINNPTNQPARSLTQP